MHKCTSANLHALHGSPFMHTYVPARTPATFVLVWKRLQARSHESSCASSSLPHIILFLSSSSSFIFTLLVSILGHRHHHILPSITCVHVHANPHIFIINHMGGRVLNAISCALAPRIHHTFLFFFYKRSCIQQFNRNQ